MQDAIVWLEQVAVGYGARIVVSGIDWVVREGELWFLVGPNGSGKSTILASMLGTLRPLAGVLGRDPQRASIDRVAYVSQRVDLAAGVTTTVDEFVSLGFHGLRLDRAERGRRFERALGIVDLLERRHADYGSLSGGQRQRAIIARALVREPRLLLVDEPTSGLDLPTREALLETIADFHRHSATTVVCVSHDVSDALRFGTHIAFCANGRVELARVEDGLDPALLERVYGVRLEARVDEDQSVRIIWPRGARRA
jgi:zinc transport system ATP-binding protein